MLCGSQTMVNNSLTLNKIFSLIILAIFFLSGSSVLAQNSMLGDANGDNKVDGLDYVVWLTKYGQMLLGPTNGDFNSDNKVDGIDYVTWLSNYGKTISPTPTVTAPPASSDEWTQFGQNAQRTSYTPVSVATPWKYKWQWNGAGTDGKKQSGHLASPDLVQPITGGGRVYTVAGNTVFALSQSNGSVMWSRTSIGTLLSTPVYDQEFVYVASGNNILYKLSAANGAIISQFSASSPLNLAPLHVGEYVYVPSANGTLYKINKTTLTKVWEYNGGSPSATPISYSSSRNILVYVTQDLFVHAISADDGSRKWRVKPTTRTYQSGNPSASGAQAEEGWPVVADVHGIVFIRYRLDWDTLWTWNPYPTTNAQIKANLDSRPEVQTLFPLSLDTGQKVFTPAVGNGGAGDGGYLPMGTQPVVKRFSNGQEVVYIIWRNGLTCASGWCDGREDATVGEMVLDNTTVAGYSAGDVRFVRFIDIQTDEMMNLTMSGDTIFHSHWLINAAKRITDRSSGKGSTYTNPIETVDAPNLIWRQVYCSPTNSQCNPQIFPGGNGFSYGPSNCPFNATTRYCSAGLYSYGDQRSYPPGFYQYHNDNNSGSNPYTVVSNGMVLVKTNDGAIIALENGNPIASEFEVTDMAMANSNNAVMGVSDHIIDETPIISYKEAMKYLGNKVTVEGIIVSAVSRRPKAIYLGFTNPHDGALLIRVFEKDLQTFEYDPMTLLGKKVRITGFVQLYWPEGKDPEIVVSDPSQIEML